MTASRRPEARQGPSDADGDPGGSLRRSGARNADTAERGGRRADETVARRGRRTQGDEEGDERPSFGHLHGTAGLDDVEVPAGMLAELPDADASHAADVALIVLHQS